LKKYKNWK